MKTNSPENKPLRLTCMTITPSNDSVTSFIYTCIVGITQSNQLKLLKGNCYIIRWQHSSSYAVRENEKLPTRSKQIPNQFISSSRTYVLCRNSAEIYRKSELMFKLPVLQFKLILLNIICFYLLANSKQPQGTNHFGRHQFFFILRRQTYVGLPYYYSHCTSTHSCQLLDYEVE